jgi:hypothetical protein
LVAPVTIAVFPFSIFSMILLSFCFWYLVRALSGAVCARFTVTAITESLAAGQGPVEAPLSASLNGGISESHWMAFARRP